MGDQQLNLLEARFWTAPTKCRRLRGSLLHWHAGNHDKLYGESTNGILLQPAVPQGIDDVLKSRSTNKTFSAPPKALTQPEDGALALAGRQKDTQGLSPCAVFLLSAGLRTIYKISQDPDRPEPQPAGPQRSAYPDPPNSGCYRSRGRGPDPRP